MAKVKAKIEEYPEIGEVCISSKKELQDILKSKFHIKEKLGACFASISANDSTVQVRGLDFMQGNHLTINLGKYSWITLWRVA